MKEIPLTQGQVALVDDEDLKRFGHLKWRAEWSPSTRSFYAVRTGPRPRREHIALHRKIMGDPPRVDHRNHDTLDNRRENLRYCTHAQNIANRKGMQTNNTSGTRGVFWNKKCRKWIAQIRVKGRSIYIGLFIDKADAAAAYAAANRQHFGAFGGNL